MRSAFLLLLLSAAPAAADDCGGLDARRRAIGDHEQARAVLKLAEGCADHVAAADLREMLGDAEGALRAVELALAAAPGDKVLLARAARLSRPEPEKALAFAERAGHARLTGEILLDLGRDKDAEKRLKRALKEDADDLDAYRALVLLSGADAGRARGWADKACARAAKMAPWKRASAQRFCARIQLDAGEAKKALAHLRRALDHDEGNLEILRELVRVKKQHPDLAVPPAAAAEHGAAPDEAIARLELLPAWLRTEGHRQAAAYWIRRGDGERAAAALLGAESVAISLATLRLVKALPGDAAALTPEIDQFQFSVLAHEELGEPGAADSLLRRGLELFPGSVRLLSMLAERELAAGRHARAREAAERLRALVAGRSDQDVLAHLHEVEFPELAAARSGHPKGRPFAYDAEDPKLAAIARAARAKQAKLVDDLLARVREAAAPPVPDGP